MAHGCISVVASKHYLVAFGDYPAIVIEPRVNGRLASALAYSLDLGDGVGKFHEPFGSREEVREEVGPEAEAENRDVLLIDQPS